MAGGLTSRGSSSQRRSGSSFPRPDTAAVAVADHQLMHYQEHSQLCEWRQGHAGRWTPFSGTLPQKNNRRNGHDGATLYLSNAESQLALGHAACNNMSVTRRRSPGE